MIQSQPLIAVALLALCACIDVDALRDRAMDASAGERLRRDSGRAPDDDDDGGSEPREDAGVPADCGDLDDVRAVRLWQLDLGTNDTITLANPTGCPIELEGLQLLLDDHEDVFGEDVDCAIAIPAFRLEAGAEVRVREAPSPGDIGALEHKRTPCEADVPFNPMRGGVTYLCDGECGPDSVVDLVAHSGEALGAPAMQFGQRFDAPLAGVTVANQESARFHRRDTEGSGPEFLASDWSLHTRYIYADFERDVTAEVSGQTTEWLPEGGQTATFNTTSNAAVGNASLSALHRGSSDGRSDGLTLELPTTEPAPISISYHVQIDEVPASGAYFDLQGSGLSVIVAGIASGGLGTQGKVGRTDIPIDADTWYHVELRNMDWQELRYDLYIDRKLVGRQLAFARTVHFADRISLYGVSSGATSFWDEIEFWRVQ